MSLLLDALKKAADEKKKESSATGVIEDAAHATSEVNDEVEMDLELAQGQEDEFPEVHQEITRHVEKVPKVEKEPGPESEQVGVKSEIDQVLELELEASDAVPAAGESENSERIKDEGVQEDSIVEIRQNQPESIEVENVPEAPEPPPLKTTKKNQSETADGSQQPPQREQVSANERKRNRDMEALSALINKNNEYRNKNRRLISLFIIVSILLVLIGSGIYAYIMLDSVESNKKPLVTVEDELLVLPVQPVNKVADVRQKDVSAVKSVAQAAENKQPKTNNQSASVKSKTNQPVTKKPIQIRKKTKEDPIGVLLAQAYAAFKKSEYTLSEKLYNKVINRDKNNHDALLGMAAIAVKQHHDEEAKRIYSKLLRLDPKDSYAKAGLSTLINQKNIQLNESQIKVMLREQPDASHLYFALGNLMLEQKRYAEAQTAFFNAWSLNKSNTDYAYNLAVSLDHLGKPVHAIEFYELTVKLYQASAGNVSIAKVKQRIEQIKGMKNG